MRTRTLEKRVYALRTPGGTLTKNSRHRPTLSLETLHRATNRPHLRPALSWAAGCAAKRISTVSHVVCTRWRCTARTKIWRIRLMLPSPTSQLQCIVVDAVASLRVPDIVTDCVGWSGFCAMPGTSRETTSQEDSGVTSFRSQHPAGALVLMPPVTFQARDLLLLPQFAARG